jgi:uncharacterized membrane protein
MALLTGGNELPDIPALQTTVDPLLVLILAVVAAGIGGVVVWRASRSGSTSGEASAASQPTASETDAENGTSATQQPPEPEPVTDDQHVVKLLEAHDGRMKQTTIVDETDWSKSKVSMLLSDMEENGEISKLRVGRENIISLAGSEPDAAGSPFEEN